LDSDFLTALRDSLVALRSSGDQLGGASFVAFAIARHTPDRTIPFLESARAV